jgi:hypothetical protein
MECNSTYQLGDNLRKCNQPKGHSYTHTDGHVRWSGTIEQIISVATCVTPVPCSITPQGIVRQCTGWQR